MGIKCIMKTILIAGGSGFIGSNLCIRLLKDNNNKVICVDNLYSSKIENIKTCIDNKNFTFIHHNIIEPLSIDEEIDEIYHLACPASPPIYQKDPIYTLKTNFIGTMNLLELARMKSAKILLASPPPPNLCKIISLKNKISSMNKNTIVGNNKKYSHFIFLK